MVYGRISYERIILVDDLEDVANEGPHLLVDFLPVKDLIDKVFDSALYEAVESSRTYSNAWITPHKDKRIKFFPDKVPEEKYQSPEDRGK